MEIFTTDLFDKKSLNKSDPFIQDLFEILVSATFNQPTAKSAGKLHKKLLV
jgi:hypothetical protein